MPLDAIFLHHLVGELNMCVGARADKIYQPSRDELVFLLRSASFSGKLLISLRTGAARLHITNSAFENPADPPSFCKLLRKHLGGAKITEIYTVGQERTVIIKFAGYNEMGDIIHPFLAVELITGRENLVLCSEDGRILDALRRSDIETASRLLISGAKYTPPERQDKADPFLSTAEELCGEMLACARPLGTAFMATINGVSPLVSRELAYMVSGDIDIAAADCDKAKLLNALTRFKGLLNSAEPYVLKDEKGLPVDFCFMDIEQYGAARTSEKAESFSALLEGFYAKRDSAHRIKTLAADISRLLTNIKNRILRRMAGRRDDLERCKNRENLRIYGELLKANLYLAEKGAETLRVQNYYDENMSYIDIPLDPALSPALNAAKYFKDYKKSHTAEQTLLELLEKDEAELLYIESVLDALSRAESSADLEAIRDELAQGGYIARKGGRKARPNAAKPKEFLSPTGFRVLVGKNNTENDLLTTKIAEKRDVWFHTKNIPGSHVIVITEGKPLDDETVLFAATLAATFSKAADSDKVAVDFTEVKNVKKPNGAKPGMVIYLTNKTVFVRPNISLVN